MIKQNILLFLLIVFTKISFGVTTNDKEILFFKALENSNILLIKQLCKELNKKEKEQFLLKAEEAIKAAQIELLKKHQIKDYIRLTYYLLSCSALGIYNLIKFLKLLNESEKNIKNKFTLESLRKFVICLSLIWHAIDQLKKGGQQYERKQKYFKALEIKRYLERVMEQ